MTNGLTVGFRSEKVERLADADSVSLSDSPDHWHTLGTDGSPIDLRLSYVYDPHDPNDGVTVHIPLSALDWTPEQFSWNVPGLLDELIVGMIKSLPKTLRVQFVPAGHGTDPRMDRRAVSGSARLGSQQRPESSTG